MGTTTLLAPSPSPAMTLPTQKADSDAVSIVWIIAPMQKTKLLSIRALHRPSQLVSGQTKKHATNAPSCCKPTDRELTRVDEVVPY